MADTTKKHMSKQEMNDFDALYQYVRCNVMGYDQNQSLSKNMVLRLKGLSKNKFMENRNIADTANYSYQTILNTFKYCHLDIQRGLRNNSFKDENHKFNFVLKIVEGNLNTVYLKMKDTEKAKEEIENHDISDAVNYVNNFKPQEDNKNNSKKYNDLW
jgi:hypothetical protein